MELRPRKLIQEQRRCEHSSEQYFPERDGLPSKTNSLPQQAQTVVFALRYRLSCQLLFTRASERLSQRICVQWLREGPGTRAGVACGARRLSRHRLPGNSLDVRRAIPLLCRRACRRLPAAALPTAMHLFPFVTYSPLLLAFGRCARG